MVMLVIKEILQQTYRGKVICLNIRHAEKYKYLDEELIQKLSELVIEELSKRPDILDYADTLKDNLKEDLVTAISIEDKSEILLKIVKESPDKKDDFCAAIIQCTSDIILIDSKNSTTEFLFKRKQTTPCHKEYVSCIKSSTVIQYMLDDKKIRDAGIIPPILSTTDKSNRKQLVSFYKKILTDKTKRKEYLKDGASFFNPNIPYLWLTDSKDIDAIKDDPKTTADNYANFLRDRLGLVDIGSDELLVEFRIPFSKLVEFHLHFSTIKSYNSLAQPTFIEGFGHSRFKAFVDETPDGCCGRTVDLGLLHDVKDKIQALDGLPEFVASIDLFPHINDWDFNIIGFTSTHPENIPIEDKDKRNLAHAHFVKTLNTQYAADML